jgi:UDP-N-acetylglucosamine--N-acetylmuramyl-(pentapeptide) pyrophosphoryl-undecaprenol N-acetylglucosamine transferase
MNAVTTQPILIMAGGTGGHVFPALAVADALRARGVEVVWMGTRRGLEARVAPAAGIPIDWVSVSGLRGKSLLKTLLSPFMLMIAFAQAFGIMLARRPRAVLGMGGFVTGPGGLSAWLLRRPLLIHEQNAIPGLTNRLLSRIAREVLEGFPGSLPNGRHVGNPVRADIAALPAPAQRMNGRNGAARLLILGGSLGARALNRLLPAALAKLDPALRPAVRHQAGRSHFDEAPAAYQAAGVTARVEPFIEDMAAAYAWADLVVCRAGALTIAELAAAGIGAILVPYPHAVDDHQTANARYLSDAGAALVHQEAALNADALAALLSGLVGDRARLLSMANAARALARPDAGRIVAERCMALAGLMEAGT